MRLRGGEWGSKLHSSFSVVPDPAVERSCASLAELCCVDRTDAISGASDCRLEHSLSADR
jgi:hypothetical protein